MIILAHTELDPTVKPGRIDVRTRLVIQNNDGTRLGSLVCRRRDGWRFYPAYQRAPSRKGWPTPTQALNNYGIRLTLVPRPDIASRIDTATTAFQRLGVAIDALEA